MGTHAPGKWWIEPDMTKCVGWNVFGRLPGEYADQDELVIVASFCTEPNAALIAAAPDLYDALTTAVQVIEQLIPEPSARGVADVVLAQARSALSRASGGADRG